MSLPRQVPPTHQAIRPWHQHLAASALATATAELCTIPICTLKTRVQNDAAVARVHQTRGLVAAARQLWQAEGTSAFVRASGVAVSTQVVSTASKFTLYQVLQQKWNPNRHVLANIASGVVSGWMSCVVTHPLDVWKIHLQMRTPLLPALARNPALAYRGFSKTLTKTTLASALFFPLNDKARQHIADPFVAGAATGLVSTLIIHPVDCAKTRHAYGKPWWFGLGSLSPYYTGLTLNVMRVVPHFAIVMGVTAAVERNLPATQVQ